MSNLQSFEIKKNGETPLNNSIYAVKIVADGKTYETPSACFGNGVVGGIYERIETPDVDSGHHKVYRGRENKLSINIEALLLATDSDNHDLEYFKVT